MQGESQTIRGSRPMTPGERVAAWAEILTILFLASFLAFSFFDKRVGLFVIPRYVWLTPVSSAALFAMGIARLRAHFQGYISGELEEKTGWQVPVSACVIILIVPVILALAVNPRRYSPQGLRKRRVTAPLHHAELGQAVNWVLGLETAGTQTAAAAVKLPHKPTILDLLEAVQAGRQKGLEGQFVTVLGQCDMLDGPAGKRFDLYRLVVTCCIADATAVSVEVARRDDVQLESGGWVRVEGIIKFDSKADPSLPVVHATKAAKIPEPSEPYL